jgi:hypothetical protein
MEAITLLRALDGELQRSDANVELCVTGGTVMPLVFAGSPGTRRPAALFGRLSILRDASARVAKFAGVPRDWLSDAARGVTAGGDLTPVMLELGRLTVYEARPDYVFAMKCAALGYEAGDGVTETVNDLRYLLRLLGLRESAAAMTVLAPYFTPRQLPPDIQELLAELVS